MFKHLIKMAGVSVNTVNSCLPTGLPAEQLKQYYSHVCSLQLTIKMLVPPVLLTTAHGPTPKTYQTLLKYIKKVNEFTAASKEIDKLIKGKDK